MLQVVLFLRQCWVETQNTQWRPVGLFGVGWASQADACTVLGPRETLGPIWSMVKVNAVARKVASCLAMTEL